MFISKIIGSVLVLVSSAAIGWYASERVRQRTVQLRELERALMMLMGDIRYAKTALPEAVDKLARHHEGSFTEFFRNVASEMQEYSGISLTEIWKQQAADQLKDTALNARDRELVSGLGEMLGVLDAQMQQNTLELAISQLKTEIGVASAKEKEKVYLFRALGVLAGIFITVLLI